MELNTKNSSGMMNGLPPTKKEDRKVGPIVGALMVVLMICVVVLYFFGKRLNTQNPVSPENTNVPVKNIENYKEDSVSEEINSIQKELDGQMKDIDMSF